MKWHSNGFNFKIDNAGNENKSTTQNDQEEKNRKPNCK